jgi:hypothetical protein
MAHTAATMGMTATTYVNMYNVLYKEKNLRKNFTYMLLSAAFVLLLLL